MILLNNLIPLINTYNPSDPKITWTKNETAGIYSLKHHTPSFDFEAWYALFSCEHSFRIYKIPDIIDGDSLEKILNKQAFLVVDNALEPFERGIDSIYQNIVIRDRIPVSQIILLTNMYDAGVYSKQVAARLGIDPIRIFWYTVFEKDLQNAIRTIYRKTLPQTLENKVYHKKFLNLNRRWRLHRPFLTALLYEKNMLDDGFISFGPCDQKDTWNHKWPELMHYFRNDKDILDILKRAEGVKDLAPMFLDTDKLHINRAEATVDTNRYYADTYFSVVAETTYCTREWYQSARFLSEKAWKPIAMKHPFILVSVPNSLEIYRIMGYKTFSSIIDESYDLELDDGKRMLKIIAEIERLCNLTQTELENFLSAAREICNYNYNLLMSKKTFITEL